MLNQDQVFLNEHKPLAAQESKRVIRVEMFKAGPQLDSEGDYKVFSTKDLDDVVQTYDPKKHEAPLIVGHDQTDSTPSLGWVQKVWREGKSLLGAIELTPKAEKMIREGTFKKVSSSFYTPDAPTNPTPGKMSLRHLALVSIPAVKGLSEFSELSDCISITNNFSEKLVKDLIDTQNNKMATRRRKKSVADHAEGLNLTINITSDETKKVPTYDDSGTQISSDGNISDYTDEQQPTNPMDSFADEEKPTPSDPMLDEDMSLDEEEDEDEDGEFDDISEDLDSDEDSIAELAANYTHKQLYEALQLQKEAKSALGEDKPEQSFGELPEFLKSKKDDEEDDDKSTSNEDEDSEKEETPKKKEEDYKEDKCSSYEEEEEDDDENEDISSLKERVQQLEEELMKQKRMAREKEISDFCESLYSSGRLTEKIASKKDLSKFLSTLNSKNAVNFSEGGKQSQYRFMKSLLKRMPAVVSFKEVATPKTAPKPEPAITPEADGYAYDSLSLETHKKAINYAETHKVDYVTALKQVV